MWGPVEADKKREQGSCSLFLGRTPEDEGKTGEGIGEFSIVTKRAQEKGRNTFDPPHMWVNTKRLSTRE